jgi:hypothetical protein
MKYLLLQQESEVTAGHALESEKNSTAIYDSDPRSFATKTLHRAG